MKHQVGQNFHLQHELPRMQQIKISLYNKEKLWFMYILVHIVL